MSFIDLTKPIYSNLGQFGVLAQTAITSTGTTTVNSGLWGIPAGTVIANMVAGTPPSGPATGTEATNAQSELSLLKVNIDAKTATLGLPTYLAATPGDYTFLPNINYRNTGANGITFTDNAIIFDGQGNNNSQFFITVKDVTVGSGYLVFTRTSFTLINGARACNIFFLADAYITATYIDNTTSPIYGNFIAGTSATFTRPSSINGHIYAKTAVTITARTAGTTVNTLSCGEEPNPVPVICYAKGTLILTKKGFVPIENIKAGDKVVTKGKIYNNKSIKRDSNLELESVMWISKFKVKSLNSKSRPICIKKDALGKNYPFQDLYVSPNHSLLLNGKMIPAKYIVNDDTIYQDNECGSVEYYHLECEYHSAIIANGVLAESYLDVDNRNVFENSIKLTRKVNLKKIYDLR